MDISQKTVDQLNAKFREASPEEIVSWALDKANRAIITTNFRPYEVAILHAVSEVNPSVPVIWCDTGYNTPDTYRHAEDVITRLGLSIRLYVPKQTKAYRDVSMGVPNIDNPNHTLFTEQVKLEPFRRAMKDHQPDVWFTNLRKGQTAHRDKLNIFSISKDGILKVSPFHYWSDPELDAYLEERNLPNEHHYYDPTKVLEHRECGLHT